MFPETDTLTNLRSAYSTAEPNSFALFLGAGVNLPAGEVLVKFKTLSWPALLEELYKMNPHLYDRTFDELLTAYAGDWPGLADELIGAFPVEQAVCLLDELIYDKNLPRGDQRSRLSIDLLQQAPNLHAVISFTTQIKKRITNSWTFKRNPRVGAVITTNYDFFFGAGWTRYQAFKRQWKIHTPFSQKPPPEHGGVYYIHGYLPYWVKERKEIVLTTSSYQKYYAPESFAREMLLQVLEKYRLIFIGFSFNDPMVCGLLTEMKDKIAGRHFAFVDEKAATSVEALGVTPIVVTDWEEIARDLKTIYCSGLAPEVWQPFGFTSAEQYWERLKIGPE